MRHRGYTRLSFHDRNRAEEVLCAVARLTERSTSLPRAEAISEEVGFDAHMLLVLLARKGLVSAHGPVGNSWFSLPAAGERAAARHCRRAAR